jgi:hypothetical protein
MGKGSGRIVAVAGVVTLCVGLASGVGAQTPATQDEDVPTMTTDDVRDVPGAIVAPRPAPTAEISTTKATARGYVRVTTKTGYSFERPASWRLVDNLAPKGAPSYFTSDAIFQDDRTGAVATAMSVDRSKVTGTVDITDRATVDNLVTAMLGAGDPKAAIKISERQTGEIGDKKVNWVRVLAEGQAKAQGGGTVPASFVVQLEQSATLLAVIAVSYPSSQQAARAAALYTVSTLELPASPSQDKAAPRPDQPRNTAGGRPVGQGR